MNEKSLYTLEFNKIIEKLEQKAISAAGKERASQLKPVTDIELIRLWQKETTEAVSVVLKRGSLPLGGIKDIRKSLKRVSVGGVLTINEIVEVSDFLYVCRKVKNYANSENKRDFFPILDPKFDSIIINTALEKEIGRCIDGNNEISDDATLQLRDIRRGIKTSNERIKEQLNSIIHSQSYKNMLQDAVITIRNDRYCVPVKQEYRNSFNGMIHDQSSTGATIFMEPMSVVQLNNKIKELKAKEKDEIEKILRFLSEKIAECGDGLYQCVEVLTELDFIFAKAELSLSMRGTEPEFNEDLVINIKKARHPLLNQDTVVPTDVYLGKDFTTLLITGPNTGGKTVCLKTIGLFTLMGQAGLHIAAFDNSELSVFDNVFADIGDEQSIEQSLSTFSSHMSNIVKILDNITPFSLVLFDELGAGTDPTEGAALAISILQHLHGKKIRAAVTTHYSELKVYALSADGVMNASCEFNVDTLKPTYKLLIGIPGKSNAFAISKKLGLSDDIIDGAKEFISHEDQRFEDVITDLEISRKTVIIEQERAEQFRREAEKLKNDFEAQKERLNSQKDKLLLKAKEEARDIISRAKDEADSIIKILNETAERQELEKARQDIKQKLSKAEDAVYKMTAPKNVSKVVPKNLCKGDIVYIYSMNQNATVINPPDGAGDVLVQAGIMKIKVNISNLSLSEAEEKKSNSKKNYSASVKSTKSLTIGHEVDLRGCMVEEGVEKADKFLDDAAMAGLEQVMIIHGKGTGVLRTAIHNHLKRHPHVSSYRLGKYGEGETGVTVVTLK